MATYTKKTHCKQGHPFSGENLLVSSKQRICRTCKNVREIKYRESDNGKQKLKARSVRYRLAHAEHLRTYRKNRRAEAYKYINVIKSAPCTDCGVSYAPYVMDLDHVRGEKKDDLSGLVDRGYSLRALVEEVDKCEVVCANCHRIRTWQS